VIGTLLQNRYRIDVELGRGGMGEVYRATDTQTDELVAVKALNSEVVARAPDLVERFVREGEALRQLNHPNIVRMIAAMQEQGQHYLIVEYVSGGSLADMLAAQGRLTSTRVMQIALEVADALTRAHHLGIIHRDLKPANVLLAEDGTPRLADFGIAHVESDQRLTLTGVLMGTMDYLSPEVCQGMPPDERADIWAFGVMLFEMLTGRLPFGGDNLTAKLLAILTEPIPDLTQLAPDVPGALADLVYRMLDKDPQQRIPSVRLVGAELEALLKGREPVTPPRVTPVPSADVPRHNLPTQLSKFIGREKDIAEVKQLLSAARLVTLTGSGGAGKTRLSLQVAAEVLDDYKEGVWFVELAALTDPALIPQTVAAVLDLREESGRPMMAVLADDLRAKTVLIILDNCEHLIEGCAQFVDAILRAAPHVKLFASSREPLSIGGEAIYRVPSLAVPDPQRLPPLEALTQYDAVRLFIERAKAAMTSFEVNDANAPAVAQLCYHLDGIPLAIELAAARVRGLKVEQIAQRLGDRFRLLTAGGRTALPHHQTLRALIDWSHSLLADQERSLFRRLSVFAGGWTIEAAEAICAGDGLESFDVLDVLLRLVDKSLVIMDEQSNETRYRMLETIREYAFDKLRDVGEIERIRNQHRDYFLAFAELANRQPPAERAQWHNRVESDHDNLRDALRWTLEQNESEFALRLCNALAAFWSARGHWTESRRWYERAIVSSRQHQAITPVSQTYRA
jgi:non-specific serine/threonine protein kinase